MNKDVISIKNNSDLADSSVKVDISLKGGSITRIVYNDEDRIWQNENFVWPSKKKVSSGVATVPSPILFPVAGKLKTLGEVAGDSFERVETEDLKGYSIDDIFYDEKTTGYFYKDKFYPMVKNGFARLCKFKLMRRLDDECMLRLTSGYKTMKSYPFDFQLDVLYKAIENGVDISYTIKNTGEEVLPFNLGDHPSFAIDKEIDRYYLLFDENENGYAEYVDSEGQKRRVEIDEDNRLPLNKDMFNNRQMVKLYNVSATKVGLCDKFKSYGIESPELTYDISSDALVLWTPDTNGLLCIQPWYAKEGSFNNMEKGIASGSVKTLQPGEEFSCSRRICFGDSNSPIRDNSLQKKLGTINRKINRNI